MISADEIVDRASQAAFGQPLFVNVLRSILVEAMVASALPEQWSWCSTDYAAFDFLHSDGARLEVKQSAARQSWSKEPGKASRCSFDIAARTGYWIDGVTWVPKPGRNADVYIFAHHPIVDDTADHRRPEQWQFHVVPTTELSDAKTISISRIESLTPSGSIEDLGRNVELARQALRLSPGPTETMTSERL